MATKTGILSDKMLEVNCKDYKALPIGFANSEFQGNMSNPYLPGIKTPKYQKSAPKPVSADVVAVSTARFLQGNRAENARLILNQYQREAKEYSPPPVNLAKINRDIMDKRERENRQAVNLLPRVYSGVSRGDLLTKQTIGQNAEPTLDIDRLISAYSGYSYVKQLQIGGLLGDVFKRENINLSEYQVSSQVLKGIVSPQRQAEGDRIAMIKRGLAALAMRQSNADLDDIFGITPPSPSPEPSPAIESKAGTSTEYSEAPTVQGQQGVAQSSTPTTQTEIEKK